MNELSADLGTQVCLPHGALDLLVPMHLVFGPDGVIRRTGPTLAKLAGGTQLVGQRLFDVVEIRRPPVQGSVAELLKLHGERLTLALTARRDMGLRGQCLALGPGEGGLLNLSLGVSFAEAVDARGLTLQDFSPCDHTVDLLYLREAIREISESSRRLTDRLLASERDAEARAATDALTGLANRRALHAMLDRLLHHTARPFALMHIDLDFFKEINDELGHAAGDALLMRVAQVLRSEIRDSDLAARVGGDEFVLVIRGTDAEALLDGIAGRILRRLEAPHDLDGEMRNVRASIGIARSSLYATPQAEQMLRDADEALYAAKRDGRGCHRFHSPAGPPTRRLP